MPKSFWRNKPVLVTGHEGFLGANLCKRLLELDAKVIGLDIDTNRSVRLLDQQQYKKIVTYSGDVRDSKLIDKIIRERRIRIIFHLAAEAIVSCGLKNPTQTFSSNVEGTWKLLESARRKTGIEAIVVASSDKAYGSHNKLPYQEDAALLAEHPYDVSKACADMIAKSYAATFNLPVAITRSGNIYGPGDLNFSRLIPDAFRCLVLGRNLVIRSDGKFIRDYIHVDDVVGGYIMIAQCMRGKKLKGEAFNFSNQKPLSVFELLNLVYRVTGKKLQINILNKAKYEIKKQYLNSSKAMKILHWRPKVLLKDGLSSTYGWYSSILKRRKI
ncbi:MAG: GDP-mannose 4,6-dehydratase [Candidatus Omnitrophica bacterium]|jgi:CDP-glucose 4,6-dehydratase|nr:GDP-mannose 4,6-dehydratase [Candidatus Omnitrophota bacterium]